MNWFDCDSVRHHAGDVSYNSSELAGPPFPRNRDFAGQRLSLTLVETSSDLVFHATYGALTTCRLEVIKGLRKESRQDWVADGCRKCDVTASPATISIRGFIRRLMRPLPPWAHVTTQSRQPECQSIRFLGNRFSIGFPIFLIFFCGLFLIASLAWCTNEQSA